MTTEISVDTSYYQRPVNFLYRRRWFIFRVCDGNFTDPNARQNLAWSVKRRAKRKLKNFTGYVVYRPGENQTILDTLDRMGFPTDAVVMIDVESWGRRVGNCSSEITDLADSLRARQGGNAHLVWCYANRGDFANVYPNRPGWLGLVVASYGSVQPANPGPGRMVGWQYTDGSGIWPVPAGCPSSSLPFGKCDHNILYDPPVFDDPTELDVDEKTLRKIVRQESAKSVRAQLNLFTRLPGDETKKKYNGHLIRTVLHHTVTAPIRHDVAALSTHVDAQTGKLAHSPDFGLDALVKSMAKHRKETHE